MLDVVFLSLRTYGVNLLDAYNVPILHELKWQRNDSDHFNLNIIWKNNLFRNFFVSYLRERKRLTEGIERIKNINCKILHCSSV